MLAKRGRTSQALGRSRAWVADEWCQCYLCMKPTVKATTVQGDAADDDTIPQLCERGFQEEGWLDVFWANCMRGKQSTTRATYGISAEMFMNTMLINALS